MIHYKETMNQTKCCKICFGVEKSEYPSIFCAMEECSCHTMNQIPVQRDYEKLRAKLLEGGTLDALAATFSKMKTELDESEWRKFIKDIRTEERKQLLDRVREAVEGLTGFTSPVDAKYQTGFNSAKEQILTTLDSLEETT